MKHEAEPRREVETALVSAYAQTFIPRWDRYPIQLATGTNRGTYIQVAKPLTLETVSSHLLGHRFKDVSPITLGAYALDEYSQAKWICFDADQPQQWEGLLSLARLLSDQGLHPYLEPSRRGGHLWLFTPVIAGKDARRFGNYLKAEHGVEDVELYPKQDRLLEGAGSFVRLPLGVHRKDNHRYHFVKLDGSTPLAPTIREQIAMLAAPQRVPLEFIEGILAYAPETEAFSPTPTFESLHTASGENLSDRLKSHISVFDFVSQYVPLDRNAKGYCPFHDDKHKSFQVNVRENYWNCYADCGGGSIIDFWAKWREVHGQTPTFKDTVTELAQMLL